MQNFKTALKKITSKNSLLILAGVVFVLIPVLLAISFPQERRSFFLNARTLGENFNLFEKSKVTVALDGNFLVFKFNKITQNDKPRLLNLLYKLGINQQVLNGFKIEVDEKTRNVLSDFLPLNLDMEIGDKSLEFKNSSFTSLKSAVSSDSYHLASGSASLDFTASDDKVVRVSILEPAQILNYASGSGQLRLSPKLNGLFPILERVSKIELNINQLNFYLKVDFK